MSERSVEDWERMLVNAGVAPSAARLEAKRRLGIVTADTSRSVADVLALPPITWPVRLTLPWSYLCSDNEKYAPALRGTTPVMILKPGYRRAKGLTHDLARVRLGIPAPEPACIPLQLVAAVWVPDNRIHDVVNFQKCAHDALEGAVYTKDRWLSDARWYKAGVDCDAPRAEITITPLP